VRIGTSAEPGRSERQRPGKLAMGWGPLFRLARTGAGFTSAVNEGPGAGSVDGMGDGSLFRSTGVSDPVEARKGDVPRQGGI